MPTGLQLCVSGEALISCFKAPQEYFAISLCLVLLEKAIRLPHHPVWCSEDNSSACLTLYERIEVSKSSATGMK